MEAHVAVCVSARCNHFEGSERIECCICFGVVTELVAYCFPIFGGGAVLASCMSVQVQVECLV